MNPLELQVLAMISGAPENGQGLSLQERLTVAAERSVSLSPSILLTHDGLAGRTLDLPPSTARPRY